MFNCVCDLNDFAVMKQCCLR